MPVGKTQAIAIAVGALVLLLALYFLYVGNVEAGVGAGVAAAAAVASAKTSRESAQGDVQEAQQDAYKRKEDITAILDKYEQEQRANRDAVAAADVEKKKEEGLALLSPEAREALGMNDTTEES